MKLVRTLFVLTTFITLGWDCVLSFNLTILHTNDVHARYEQTNKYSSPCGQSDADKGKCFGGFPRLATKICEFRQKNNHTILLDGGDQYQGTLWFYHYGGNVTAHFMNWLKYDAMTFGNHEFDRGINGLIPFLQQKDFPVVSANVDSSLEPRMQGRYNKSHVLTVEGQKIGVIGYTTTDAPSITSTEKLIFHSEVPSIQAEVDKLTSEGINKIIAVGHSGFTIDQKIAREVNGVDVVIGGHTNTFLYTGTPPSIEKPKGPYPLVVNQTSGKKVLILEDYAYGKYLGHIDIQFDDEGNVESWAGNPVLLDNNTVRDPATLAEMQPWKMGVEESRKEVVGFTNVYLEGDQEFCRRLECNMGNLIADSMVRFFVKAPDDEHWNNVSIGLMNSGGIRAPIDQGNITLESILSVLPFRNAIELIKLKGKHIVATLEHSVSRYSSDPKADLFGGFLQMSGLKVVYDLSKPVGSRVADTQVKCTSCIIPKFEPIVDEQVYDVVIPDFVAKGGDGYTVIRDNKIPTPPLGLLDSSVFTNYLKKYSPIIHGLDGRISFAKSTAQSTTPSTSPSDVPSTSTTTVKTSDPSTSATTVLSTSAATVKTSDPVPPCRPVNSGSNIDGSLAALVLTALYTIFVMV